MNGSSSSSRRANVFRGSNRAHRKAESKSKPATSEAEFQVGIDLAARIFERLDEVVLQRKHRQRIVYQISVRLGPCPPFRLFDESWTDPTGNTTAFLLEK